MLILKRNRLLYFGMTLTVVLLGLGSRWYSAFLPKLVNPYIGDLLWALMLFLLICTILNRRSPKQIALAAIIFSFSIEVSQLYHASWIDEIRRTTLGGLVLGFGFLWSDLLSYTLGVTTGYFIDKQILKRSCPYQK